MRKMTRVLGLSALIVISAVSCRKADDWNGRYDSVTVFVAEAYNNLSDGISGTSKRSSQSLNSDLQDLCLGEIPDKSSHRAVLAFCHNTYKDSNYDWTTPNSPVLIRLYKEDGRAIMDTIKVFSSELVTANASVLGSVLNQIRSDFPSDHYGMIYSSHGSGWLPTQYYSGASPAPMSVGTHLYKKSSVTYEIDIKDFAAAIPMHLDYLIFDACLMGGVEVAYELRKVCDYLVFSPAEIFVEGFYYVNIASHLLKDTPDLKAVCEDYMNHYSSGATVSLVKCSELEQLAQCAQKLATKYAGKIMSMSASPVQRFYTGNHPWFYDFRDIFKCAAATESELAELDAALAKAVIYKDYTTEYGKGTSYYIKILKYSGLSMYLPRSNQSTLNEYYKTLAWNKAVGLVNVK